MSKFIPAQIALRNPDKLDTLPDNVQRALLETGELLTRLVDRSEGVVVGDCSSLEFWRASSIETTEVKLCLKCGVDLTGVTIKGASVLATPRPGVQATHAIALHFCASCKPKR